jgi:CPA1 family monovalent cation:H+ antiporter
LPCIWSALQDGQITDEARRRIERELDLEEASLAFKRKGEPDPL